MVPAPRGSRNPHYHQKHPPGKSFSFSTTSSCQSPCLLSNHSEDYYLDLGWASVGCRNTVSIWGVSSALEMKASQYTPGQWEQRKHPCFIPPPHTHTSPATLSQLSSSLKLWFPGSCWSSSGLLRSTFAQGCLCLRADKQLCTLAMPQLPCPLLPDSLLSKGSTGPCLLERNECPKLPGRSKCTAGYSHKGNLSSPFAWRWWWKSLN